MIFRFGAFVFASTEFKAIVFHDDGKATLWLAGMDFSDENSGIVLDEAIAKEVDRLFSGAPIDSLAGGRLDVCVIQPAKDTRPKPLL